MPVSLIIGRALWIAGWLVARHVSRCRTWRPELLLLDQFGPLVGFAFVTLGSGKPIFAGTLVFLI